MSRSGPMDPCRQIENARPLPKQSAGVLTPMAQPRPRASGDVHYCTTTHVLVSDEVVFAATWPLSDVLLMNAAV